MAPDDFSRDVQLCRGLWSPVAIILEGEEMADRCKESSQQRSDRLMLELVDAMGTVLGQWSSQQMGLGATGAEVGAALIRSLKVIAAGVYHSRGCCRHIETRDFAKILMDAEKDLVRRLQLAKEQEQE